MTTISTRRLLWLGGLIVVVALATTGCSEAGDVTPPPAANPYVEALPANRAEMSIPLPDGTLPCALGQVEWGNQIFNLAEYPSCQSLVPDVAVFCLSDQAQWTADAITISGITTEAITLDAQREGICGIFPQK